MHNINMKKNIVYIYIREIDFCLELDIEFLGVRMLTGSTDELLSKNKKTENKGKSHLAIILTSELELFESISDGYAYIRPKYLIACGILSFFTQQAFTPFESYQQSAYLGSFSKKCLNKFIYEKKDLYEDFNQFNEIIKFHTDKKFIYSLLDRWRKGLYMEAESNESMLYDDETMLSYFHILELLSTKYEYKQKLELKERIKQFTNSIFKDSFLFDGSHLRNESESKSKIINGLLMPELSVSSKIFYMFKEQNMLTDRLKNFINEFVKNRNLVAHGSHVYQDRIIFPVPPFFPLIKNRVYPIDIYRILTAKAIANYIGLNLYSQEWEDFSHIIIPSIEELKDFLKKKKYNYLTNEDFCFGVENDITPYVVSHYCTGSAGNGISVKKR
ncbi:MAG: hypothetical protein SCALA702_02390 [Melioribacteraceae bacterium]|nr:MAG: hypothetical protein SCALA702_02390 [Melioribacteraceae bacterium]